jgi:hypothetical protein
MLQLNFLDKGNGMLKENCITPRDGIIDWGARLMKQRSLVLISPSPSPWGQNLLIKKAKSALR